MQAPPLYGVVNLRIIQARLTHNKDLFSKMDPYVIIRCNGQSWKTTVKAGQGKHPVWNENFQLNISSLNDEVYFELMDRDTFSRDDLIGKAYVRAS